MAAAVAFFLHSFSWPRKPSVEVVSFLWSHCDRCEDEWEVSEASQGEEKASSTGRTSSVSLSMSPAPFLSMVRSELTVLVTSEGRSLRWSTVGNKQRSQLRVFGPGESTNARTYS